MYNISGIGVNIVNTDIIFFKCLASSKWNEKNYVMLIN